MIPAPKAKTTKINHHKQNIMTKTVKIVLIIKMEPMNNMLVLNSPYMKTSVCVFIFNLALTLNQ